MPCRQFRRELTLITLPAVDSRGESQFAYIADPEGSNLIELVDRWP
ncbi:hypothetical protein [Labedaea rhizosphaerae]|uniref:Uncharacterized protein n=1 Tax=Labedaea rhizosphaerae TaxID=598644 RepID=A0A4R6SF17_LABRH|nr:hypothetical protein [Labedaea rhizosphaerae]TDQ00562.1 hypothetical protein EV186_102423 [Labedaea rhizosphaerae]